jgi:hypothetical protein
MEPASLKPNDFAPSPASEDVAWAMLNTDEFFFNTRRIIQPGKPCTIIDPAQFSLQFWP